jgi:hypothetical protein
MFKAACHCGNICLTAKAPPVSITSCNCSFCHRLGALWGYYKGHLVDIDIGDSAESVYAWAEKTITYYRCSHCGCTTHYIFGEGDQRIVAINCRMAEVSSLDGIRVRKFDGLSTWKYLD